MPHNTDHVPDLFESVYTGAPEAVIYDMWFDDLTFDAAMDNHINQIFGYGDTATLDPFEIENNDPFAVEKAVYQKGVEARTGAPMMGMLTPWGPSLEQNEVDSLIGLYPGIDALGGADPYDFDAAFNSTDMVLDYAGDGIDDLLNSIDDAAVDNGWIDSLNSMWDTAGDWLNQLNPLSPEIAYASPLDRVSAPEEDRGGAFDWLNTAADFVTDTFENLGRDIFGMSSGISGASASHMEQVVQTTAANEAVADLHSDFRNTESITEFLSDLTASLTDPNPWALPEDVRIFVNQLRDQGTSSFVIDSIDNILGQIERTNTTIADGGPGIQPNLAIDYSPTTVSSGGGDTGGMKSGYLPFGGGGLDQSLPRGDRPAEDLASAMTYWGTLDEDDKNAVSDAMNEQQLGNVANALDVVFPGWNPTDPVSTALTPTTDKPTQPLTVTTLPHGPETMTPTPTPLDPLTDVFRSPGADISPHSIIFERQFNQLEGSSSHNAQQVLPHLSADADVHYYLTRPPSVSGVTDYGVIPEYGWGGETEMDAERDQDRMTDYGKYVGDFLGDISVLTSEETRESVREMVDAMSALEGLSYDDHQQIVSEAGPDLAWQRAAFIDPTDSKAINRTGALIGTYISPKGAGRYDIIENQKLMTSGLSSWVRSGRSVESYLRAYVK